MKYLNNNNNLGIRSVSPAVANSLMESLGFEINALDSDVIPMHLYENQGEVYGMSDDVYEYEGNLLTKIEILDESTYLTLSEANNEPLTAISYNDVTYNISETIYEVNGEYYALLENIEDAQEESEEVVTETLNIDGTDYLVCESEADADWIIFLKENEDGEWELVDEGEHSHQVYIAEEIVKGKKVKIKGVSKETPGPSTAGKSVPDAPNALKGVSQAGKGKAKKGAY